MNRLHTLISGAAPAQNRSKDKAIATNSSAKTSNGASYNNSNGNGEAHLRIKSQKSTSNSSRSKITKDSNIRNRDHSRTRCENLEAYSTNRRAASQQQTRPRAMEDLPTGYIQTVRGPLIAKSLGITLTHEHLYHRATQEMFKPRKPEPDFAYMAESPFEPQNLWWIRFHPYSHKDNLRFDDSETQEAITDDLSHFYQNGGNCIVECSCRGLDGDRQVLRSLSLESKLNIVAGTGFYVSLGHNKDTLALKTEQVYQTMKHDFFVGDSSGSKCGILGELGTIYPIDPFEKKVLRAAACLQQEHPTIPVSIHPGRHRDAPFEAMRIFLEAGGVAKKTVMCHLERTLMQDSELLEFARLGSILEFDLFGVETSYYELSDEFDMPSDAVRISRLKNMIKEGLGDRLVISHDIHTKERLMRFGGHGFSHIVQNVVPKMQRRGFSKEQVQDILVNTPRRWLTL